MAFALIATILGTICLSVMIVTDKLMLGDCYQGKPNHAWFVSSIAGAGFGLILTILIWFAIALLSDSGSFITILKVSLSLFLWKGALVTLAGVLGIQILLHYFNCFSEDAHSASIASWIAATPIFVFCVTILLILAEDRLVFDLVEEKTFAIHPLFILGAIVATFGLVAFEVIANQSIKNARKYRKDLILMITFNVLTIILLQQVLVNETDFKDSLYILALLPYYWVGFLAGIRVMLPKKERLDFKSNWKNSIRHSLRAVLFVEVIGMLVFCFEYFGLAELDPTYVSIIFGSHIILVYFIDILLTRLGNRMKKRNQTSIKILGLEVSAVNLPQEKLSRKEKVYEWLAFCFVIIGIVLCSKYIL